MQTNQANKETAETTQGAESTAGGSTENAEGAPHAENPIAMMKSLHEKTERQLSQEPPDSPRKASSTPAGASERLLQLETEKSELEVRLVAMKETEHNLRVQNEELLEKLSEKEEEIKKLQLELDNARLVLTTVENGLDGHLDVQEVNEHSDVTKL